MMTKTHPAELYNDFDYFDDGDFVHTAAKPIQGSLVKPVNRFYLVTLDMIGNWLMTLAFGAFAAWVLCSLYAKQWSSSALQYLDFFMIVGPAVMIAAALAKWISFKYHCQIAMEALRRSPQQD